MFDYLEVFFKKLYTISIFNFEGSVKFFIILVGFIVFFVRVNSVVWVVIVGLE